MLKQLVNEARFQIQIKTTGPLLVKSGQESFSEVKMEPVLTYRNGTAQVFIPGASLKGAFRSHVERVIRTLRPNEVVVSDPFKRESSHADQSAGEWFNARHKELEQENKSLDNATVYKDSCPVTRLFGSTWFIGRVAIGDAYLVNEEAPQPVELRDGIGIDRLTGGTAHGAKFNLRAVSAGTTFAADVLLRNFECWQLGALLLVVQDMEDELLRLGSGKSRGLGAVKASVGAIHLHRFDAPEAATGAATVRGLGHYLGANSPYGTWADDVLTLAQAPSAQLRGIRWVQTFADAAPNAKLTNLKQAAVQEFVKRIKVYHRYKA